MGFLISMFTGSIKLGMSIAAKMITIPFKIGIKVAIFCLTTPFILGGAMGFFGGCIGTFILCDSDRRQKAFSMLGF